MTTKAKYNKRPLVIEVTEDGITIGPQGLTPQVVEGKKLWEMILGKAERDEEPWNLIAKGKYYIQAGLQKLDLVEESVGIELVKDALVSLSAALWNER